MSDQTGVTGMPAPAGGAWVTVDVFGRPCRVVGDPQDIYFQNAPGAVGQLKALHALARAVLAPDATVFDVGANVGFASLALAPFVPQGRVLAFEPVPALAPFLAATLAANPPHNIEHLAVAVGARPGVANLHVGPNFAAGSHLVTADHAAIGHLGVVEVPVVTLDQVVQERGQQRLDFIKIDVEGFESDVLEGAAETLARFHPVVFAEMNSFTLIAMRDQNPRRFVELCLARFRHVFWLDGAGALQRLAHGQPLYHFIHEHLVRHHLINDLICCDDDSWVGRFQPVA